MRGSAFALAAVALGGVLFVGASYSASVPDGDLGGYQDTSTPQPDLHKDDIPVEPDAQVQRDALNTRLLAMIEEGKGARLRDEPLRSLGQRAQVGSPRSGVRSGNLQYRAPRLDLTTPPNIPSNPLDCLTQAVYYEARNESEAGQAAVAEVVMNRVRHSAYPNDICAVVYQRNSRTCQFTFTCDGSIGRGAVRAQAWSRAQRIAREVYEGRSASQLPQNSVNYHANYVRPSWGQRLERVRQIGAHIFYGSAHGGGLTPGAEHAAGLPASSGNLFARNVASDDVYGRQVSEGNGADRT